MVHASRLKKVTVQGVRLTTKLVRGLGETDRLDFDENLLPEDSWAPDKSSARYEVKAILDDDTARTTILTGFRESTWSNGWDTMNPRGSH